MLRSVGIHQHGSDHDSLFWKLQHHDELFLMARPSQEDFFLGTYYPTTSVTRLGDFLHFGQLFKLLATINLPKSLAFLGNFCKGVKIFNFTSKINFGQLLQTSGNHLLVTLWTKSHGSSINWFFFRHLLKPKISHESYFKTEKQGKAFLDEKRM